jgi:hypothetical protein
VEEQAVLFARVGHGEAAQDAAQHAGVAHLPAGLGVERRHVEQDVGGPAFRDAFDRRAVGDDPEHARLVCVSV